MEKLQQDNKELRTRVAELEKKVEEYEATKQTDRSFEALMNYQLKLNELQNRLSTLKEHHDCLKYNYRILDEKREVGIDYATKEIDKLTMRLSTVEKENTKLKQELDQFPELVDKAHLRFLESRLSTLLKVCEGMEKALVCMIEDAEELRIINRRNLGERRDEKINSTYYAEIEKAKSVLADFRAVKEGK